MSTSDAAAAFLRTAAFLPVLFPPRAKGQHQKLRIKGYGLLGIDGALDGLVLENAESIAVRGKVICSQRVKEHFGLR